MSSSGRPHSALCPEAEPSNNGLYPCFALFFPKTIALKWSTAFRSLLTYNRKRSITSAASDTLSIVLQKLIYLLLFDIKADKPTIRPSQTPCPRDGGDCGTLKASLRRPAPYPTRLSSLSIWKSRVNPVTFVVLLASCIIQV